MKAMLFVGGPMDGETRCIELERVIVDERLYPKPSIFDPLEQYYREVKYERTIVMLPDGKQRIVMVPSSGKYREEAIEKIKTWR